MDNQSPNTNKNTNLGIVISTGESVVQEVKKHPIGATFSLIAGLALSIVCLIASIAGYGLTQTSGIANGDTFGVLIIIGGLIATVGIIIATFVNIYIFRMNSLIITTEKVAQVLYKTIFDRKVMQLSMERVQDVTVSQVGLFPRVFKYGTLIIETAGDHEDCIFSFAPNPYELSRVIMDLHEKATSKSRTVI